MGKKILIACLATMFVFGCKKAEKQPETAPVETTGAGSQDTNVQAKDMTFDAQGSDSGNIAGLFTINFEYDKSNLSAEGREKAQKNADWMKQNASAQIQIEGHCDRHGSIEYNLALGERRAKSVMKYMTSLGVESSRLSVISYGKEKPLDSAENEAADGKNRRANFVVQK